MVLKRPGLFMHPPDSFRPGGAGIISRLKEFAGFGGLDEGLAIDISGMERIGGGCMSDVYRAYDRQLCADVALKIALGRGSAVSAIRNEARVLRGLGHPNIVGYMGSGVFESGPLRGRHFLETEYLEGGTLAARLAEKGALGWDETLRIIKGVCGALCAAHEKGIIHRDIKPDNILLTKCGPKLLDFGVSGEIGFSLRGLIALPFSPGDVHYTAPEFFGGVVDARSDIYSLGAIMYRALAGEPPLSANELIAVMGGEPWGPKPLREMCAGPLPEGAEYLIMRAIARYPELRFQGMADFRAALDAAEP